MKIGFLGPFGSEYNSDYGSPRQVGGIEHQLFGLATELCKLGNDVFITRNWKGSGKETVIQGVRFVNANFLGSCGMGFYYSPFPCNYVGRVYYYLKSPQKLGKLKLDIVNFSEVLPGWIGTASSKMNNCKKVFITHNNDIYIQKRGSLRFKQFLSKRLLFSLQKRCDATVAVSQGTATYLNNMGLSYDALIPEAIHPFEYFSSNEEPFLLAGGRLVKHKRINDLIRAYSNIEHKISQELVILGEGQEKLSLLSMSKVLGIENRVKFLPFLSKTGYRKLLSKCSVFVFPSEAEVFGIAVLEAMASGKPVIARDTVGPRDIITHLHDGLLFRNNDELEYYLELLLSDEDLRKRIGTNARKTVEKKYSFRKMAEKYSALYRFINES